MALDVSMVEDHVMGKRDRNTVNIARFKNRRRELRTDGTAAEAVLWKFLQRRQLCGKKFRRQFGISRYILDFFCPECCLAVELDGAPHFSAFRDDYDFRRTKYLESLGIRVIRFENRLVFEDIEGVLETIRLAILGTG
jgi:very-short-patch-repair endonuclease